MMGGILNVLPTQVLLSGIKVKIKSTLEQATKAERGRCIALLFV
jgi:hypothetical protein